MAVGGVITDKENAMVMDNSGGAYGVASKEFLPENFRIMFPCLVQRMEGSLPAIPAALTRNVTIRFASAETTSHLGQDRGYTISLAQERNVITRTDLKDTSTFITKAQGNRGIPDGLVLLTISFKDGTISVICNDELLITCHDDAPLSAKTHFSIGGLKSIMVMGPVEVTDLGGIPGKLPMLTEAQLARQLPRGSIPSDTPAAVLRSPAVRGPVITTDMPTGPFSPFPRPVNPYNGIVPTPPRAGVYQIGPVPGQPVLPPGYSGRRGR
jgi:hypothetical protein